MRPAAAHAVDFWKSSAVELKQLFVAVSTGPHDDIESSQRHLALTHPKKRLKWIAFEGAKAV
jgi:hypothetical protein